MKGTAVIIVGKQDDAKRAAINAQNKGYIAYIMEPNDDRLQCATIPIYYVDPITVDLHEGPMGNNK